MNDFVIETGVPLPDRRPNGIMATLRALHAAPSGSSVLFHGRKNTGISSQIRSVDPDKWSVTRNTPDGVRVWRL